MNELLNETSEEGTKIRRSMPFKCAWALVHGKCGDNHLAFQNI
jgi:hypothetical protein